MAGQWRVVYEPAAGEEIGEAAQEAYRLAKMMFEEAHEYVTVEFELNGITLQVEYQKYANEAAGPGHVVQRYFEQQRISEAMAQAVAGEDVAALKVAAATPNYKVGDLVRWRGYDELTYSVVGVYPDGVAVVRSDPSGKRSGGSLVFVPFDQCRKAVAS